MASFFNERRTMPKYDEVKYNQYFYGVPAVEPIALTADIVEEVSILGEIVTEINLE